MNHTTGLCGSYSTQLYTALHNKFCMYTFNVQNSRSIVCKNLDVTVAHCGEFYRLRPSAENKQSVHMPIVSFPAGCTLSRPSAGHTAIMD